MAQFKHTVQSHSEAAEVFATARKNRKGVVVLGNNTTLREIRTGEGVDYAIRLHDTNVVTFTEDGRIFLNTGGHYSMVTADRMNAFTPFAVRINRRRGEFVLSFMVGGKLEEQGTFAQHFAIL